MKQQPADASPSPPPPPQATNEQLKLGNNQGVGDANIQVVDQAIQASFSSSSSSNESSTSRNLSAATSSTSTSCCCSRDALNCHCACACCKQQQSPVDNNRARSTSFDRTSATAPNNQRQIDLNKTYFPLSNSLDDLLAGSYVHQAADGSRIVVSRGWPPNSNSKARITREKANLLGKERRESTRTKVASINATDQLNKLRVKRRQQQQQLRKGSDFEICSQSANKLCSSLINSHRPNNLSLREKQQLLVEFLTRLPATSVNQVSVQRSGLPKAIPSQIGQQQQVNDQLQKHDLDNHRATAAAAAKAPNAGLKIKHIERRRQQQNASLLLEDDGQDVQIDQVRKDVEEEEAIKQVATLASQLKSRRKSRPIIVELSSPVKRDFQASKSYTFRP